MCVCVCVCINVSNRILGSIHVNSLKFGRLFDPLKRLTHQVSPHYLHY